jgi:subtilase family serine protease
MSRARVGSAPTLSSATRITGRLRPSRRLTLTLTLTSRHPLEMARAAGAVATPGSDAFRRYLTVGQFARRFGASDARVRAVSRALRAAGLTVAPVQANHLTLSVSGTATEVQYAFDTRLDAVRLSDGRPAFADRAAPTLAAGLAPDVDSVVGLSTLARPQSGAELDSRPRLTPDFGASHPDVVTGGPQPCAAAVSAATLDGGSYTADDIQAAYDFSGLYAAGGDGAGQSVAVFELEKVRPADLASYEACYGIAAKVSYVNVGHPQYAGDDEESALDIEQILGLAPAAHVIVYQSSDTDEAGVENYARIVSQDRAKTVSVSWGACEEKITADGSDLSIVRAENTLFEEAALQGQSILSASGDTGSAGCHDDLDSNRLAVQDPSSQPFATGVGATTLYSDVNGTLGLWDPTNAAAPLLESVWNDGYLRPSGSARVAEATGGGLSRLWAMPRYQRRAAAAVGVHNADSSSGPCRSSADCREVPDVSADGDPQTGYLVYVSAGSERGWNAEGGTSAAAPLWAALTADADTLPACRGASIGFENPSLYTLAATAPGDLRDITSANPFTGRADNDATNTNRGLYPVTAGYDMTTGLGVPNGAALAAGLCGLRAPVYTVSVQTPRGRAAVAHSHFTLRLRGTDSGRQRLRYSARGLPPGLRISPRGVISGVPHRPGRSTVTVTAVDHATNRTTVRFRLSVLTPAAQLSRVSLSGVARRRPTLSLTVERGRLGPDLRSLTIRLPRGLTVGAHGGGVHISAGRTRVRFHFRRIRDGLTITFRRPQGEVHVTLGRPSLFASRGLASTARAQRGAKVTVRVSATDRRRRSTRRSYRLRLGH